MPTVPFHFFNDPIDVEFINLPVREKSPHCPDRFTWHDETFVITQVVEEWIDYRRRGRMSRNMAPAHLAIASRMGSWGVGRFYFRVRTSTGRIFELYFDRAPEDVDEKGNWFLMGKDKK